jgi:pilus assembly protein CpaB
MWAGMRASAPPLGTAPALVEQRKQILDIAREVPRAMSRHRRLIAACCIGIAVATALGAMAPKTPARVRVIAAAHDLPGATALTASDLRSVELPAGAVPAGAITAIADVVGRTVAGPVRRGEPITDVRLDGGPLEPPAPGLVAEPVRFADAEAARLLQPGQHIDVLAASTALQAAASTQPATATSAEPGMAALVAADVTVVAIPPPTGSATSPIGAEGALVVLATTADQARALAQAQVSARLSAVVVH